MRERHLFLLVVLFATSALYADPTGKLFEAILAEPADFSGVDAAINAGANLEARLEGDTPLLLAAKKRRGEIFDLIIKYGADVNAKDATGNTAMHIQARNGDSVRIKALFKKRARLNVQNDLQQTPLHVAMMCTNFAEVRTLFDLHANPRIRDHRGINAIELAADLGDENGLALVEYLNSSEPGEEVVGKKQSSTECKSKWSPGDLLLPAAVVAAIGFVGYYCSSEK